MTETNLAFALALTLFGLGYYLRGFIGSWHCRLFHDAATKHDLRLMENRIMATQAELTEQLNAMTEQAGKVAGETRTLLTRIEDLLAQLANAQVVNPELQAAADALKAQLDVVDELVPDAPPAE